MLEEDIVFRAKVQRNKIIEALRAAGTNGCTNIFLYNNITKSLGARLSELYERGYYIECKKLKDSVYNYVLIWEPIKPQPKPMRAEDILIDKIQRNFSGEIDIENLLNLLRDNDLIISRKAGAHKRKMA
ncbi:hypothetical protein [Viridibacillus arvi]|uniref:hypothetical protein n=1 Tax=Viridibacillus arvi TaxID=263475 RepID=UPI0034CE9302